mgnify:CR=1 FL=1
MDWSFLCDQFTMACSSERRHEQQKMERLNGEIRDCEKVMRGLKKIDAPIIEGYQIFHNYVKPHMALDGKTPADKDGIKIQGENKWIMLIQNASLEWHVM